MEQRKCNACEESKEKDSFSASQWKKSARRCRECIENGREIGSSSFVKQDEHGVVQIEDGALEIEDGVVEIQIDETVDRAPAPFDSAFDLWIWTRFFASN